MKSFIFRNPVKIVFGPGKVSRLGKEVAGIGQRAMLVTGRGSARRTGLLKRVMDNLAKADVEVVLFEGIEPNPRIGTIRRAASQLEASGAQVVIALGGGSVMDASKVIAASPFYGRDPWEMVRHGQVDYRPPQRALPIVTVPTLAATGSECNSGAVVTNEERGEKCVVVADCLYPAVAVIDPELTATVPPDHTAYGALDIMVHVMEPYFNGADNAPLQDRLQESVMVTALEELPKVLERPDNLVARANLQWASVVGLNGWVNVGSGGSFPIHAIEHVLSGRYDVAHGAGLSVLLLAWMRTAASGRVHKHVQFARRVMGVPTSEGGDQSAAAPIGADEELRSSMPIVEEGITRLESYMKSVGLPVRMGELGVRLDELEAIADDVLRLSGDSRGNLPGVPALDRPSLLRLMALASVD